VGLYNLAYPIYTIFLTLSTAGLPLAVSKFVAEHNAKGDYRTSERLFRLVTTLLTLSGIAFALLLYAGAPLYVNLFLNGNRDMIPIVRAITPALLIFPAMATLRGYFQGWQSMSPTGNSQMVEQIVRVVTVLGAAIYMMDAHYSIVNIAAVATFGAFTGGVGGLLVLLVYIRKQRQKVHQLLRSSARPSVPMKPLMRRVLAYALPISLAALVVPLFNQVDASTVEGLLRAAHFSIEQTEKLFGILGGRAWKIIAIPATFSSTIALTVIPMISESHARRDLSELRQRAFVAIRLTVYVAVPSAVGLAILAGPVDTLLFRNALGAGTIAILSISNIFSSLESVSSGALQGLGKTYRPVVNLFIGLVIKIILNLLMIPLWGIAGAAMATVLSYIVASQLNLGAIRTTISGIRLPASRLWTVPILGSALMYMVIWLLEHTVFHAYASSQFIGHAVINTLFLLLAVGIGGFVYVGVLLITGAVNIDELLSFPKIGRLFRFILRK